MGEVEEVMVLARGMTLLKLLLSFQNPDQNTVLKSIFISNYISVTITYLAGG